MNVPDNYHPKEGEFFLALSFHKGFPFFGVASKCKCCDDPAWADGSLYDIAGGDPQFYVGDYKPLVFGKVPINSDGSK